FFQADDGIRVFHVTGVQTCALPISIRNLATNESVPSRRETRQVADWNPMCGSNRRADIFHEARLVTRGQRGPAVLEQDTRKLLRSEERRVGKECGYRWSLCS